MELILYQDMEEGVNSVMELLMSYAKDRKNYLRIIAVLKHIVSNGFFCDYVKPCRNGKCYDGEKVEEIRISISSEKKLLRIFFVFSDNQIILCDWLKKRHNPDWGKTEQNRVDKEYYKKIENTKEYYKKARENNKLLSKMKL